MAEKAELPKTPDVFLAELGNALVEKDGVDADLAEILKKHVLTAAPAKDAMAQAKVAIVKLAAKRAAPPKVEVAGG